RPRLSICSIKRWPALPIRPICSIAGWTSLSRASPIRPTCSTASCRKTFAGITNLAHLVNRHGRLGPMQPGQLPQLPDSAQTLPQVMDRLSALLGKPNANAGPARENAAETLADLCVSALSTGEERVAFFDRLVGTLLPLDHSRVFWGDRMLLLDKNMGFIEDPVFADAYNEIKDNKNFNQYKSSHTECWRLHALAWAAQHALSLDSDFLECGVFKGDRASLLAKVTDFGRQRKTFYLYDSFAGFSPDYSSADDFPDSPGFFDFAHKLFSEPGLFEEVTRRFSAYPNVRIVRGVLPDVLAETAPDKISFMHMDLNSPRASVACLEVLFDRMIPGGMIIFDDYGWYAYRREKELADVFMAARGYQILELPTGQGLLLKR